MKKLIAILSILLFASVGWADVAANVALNMPLDKSSTSTGADILRTWATLAGSPGIAGDVITLGGAEESVWDSGYWIIGNTYTISATVASYAGAGPIYLPYDGAGGAVGGVFGEVLENGHYEPQTEDGLYDLQRLQRATWGRLGYRP